VAALESIADAADGIMVARGDLGVEMPLEQLPAVQKACVKLVNERGGLVIVATEMLESMITNPRPTRAEVTDVANAILDGADAVMLSGETASGKYPVEAVRTMAAIIEEMERHGIRREQVYMATDDISTGVAAAAAEASDRLNAAVLVAYTQSGHTARLISELRPNARVLGLTPHPNVVRRMCLYWGVEGRLAPTLSNTDAMIAHVKKVCREEKLAPPGSTVIIVAGTPLNASGRTNLMTVRRM